MKVELQRNLDRWVGPPLCWLLTQFARLQRDWDDEPPRRILVILLSEMGSLVLARPMLEKLQERYPEAALYALLFRQNREVLELVEILPEENIVTLRNGTFWQLATDSLRALRRLRRVGIDTVIDCELFSRVSSILSFLSGAKRRVGFHRHRQEGLYRGDFINRPVLYNPYQHISQQFLTLAEAIDSDGSPRVKRIVSRDALVLPALSVSQQELAGMRARVTTDFPQLAGKRLVLLYAGGGLLPIRAWPIESFCTLAADFVERGYVVGIIGLAQDRELARTIQKRCGPDRTVDFTGYTKTVRELMWLFHLAALLVTNDGGPGHFASMTPVPTIIFFGPETPTLYGSLDPEAVHLYTGLACSPCLTAYNHRDSPCDGDNVCLKEIQPGMVSREAERLLEKNAGIVFGEGAP